MKPSDPGSLVGGQAESAAPTTAASQNCLQKTYFGSNFASPESPGGGDTVGHLITALHFPPTLGGKTAFPVFTKERIKRLSSSQSA